MAEKPNPKISVLLYGKAGTGKSILAHTFPKPLIFDFDNGHKLYADKFPSSKVLTEEDGDLFSLLQEAIKKIEAGDKTFQYETIVIDSLTNAENKAVANAKGMNATNWVGQLYTGKGKALSYQDWGGISGSTIALFTYMRSLPINLVVITQIETAYDNGVQKFRPNLVGKGSDESLHFPDFVCFIQTKNGDKGIERYLHLSSTEDDNFIAKARLLGGNVEAIKNPSYKKIIDLVNKDKLNLNFND